MRLAALQVLLLGLPFLSGLVTAKVEKKKQQSLRASGSKSGHEVGWPTDRVVDRVIADLNLLATTYNYNGPFVLQAGTAVMTMGCRLDEWERYKRQDVIRARRTVERPLHDIDVWIPDNHWRHPTEGLQAKITAAAHGGVQVPGGFEWAPASALGNVHELDVRDGRKQWGDVRILHNHKNWYDLDLTGQMTNGNAIMIIGCNALIAQKRFLAEQTDCDRAHDPAVDCAAHTPAGAYAAAVARGATKRAQDRADIQCLEAKAESHQCEPDTAKALHKRYNEGDRDRIIDWEQQ